MADLLLFIDASVNPRLKIGCGAYLAVHEDALLSGSLETGVTVKKFEQTSSTKLEVQTLLWALHEIQPLAQRVKVMTDSQNIIGLPGRRDGLEKKQYRTKKNKRIANAELYQEFYRMTDQLYCEFVKIRGHKASNRKDEMDRIFTLVDRAARKALRKIIRHPEGLADKGEKNL